MLDFEDMDWIRVV